MKIANQSFEDFLSEKPLSSTGALKGRLKKWTNVHGALNDEQKQLIQQMVSNHKVTLSKNKAKEWENFTISNL